MSENPQLLHGLTDATVSALIDPLLEMTNRGGKAWRSFLGAACVNAVGGDSTRFRPAMAIPEIMHVSSLIIDDIQVCATPRACRYQS